MTNEMFLDFAGKYGLPFAMLAYAIYHLNRNNTQAYAKLDAERNDRITGMERHIQDCEQDRRALWKHITKQDEK